MDGNIMETKESPSLVITPEALKNHWQGHRRLTRKVITTFPEDKLFNYSIGGMRPFSDMVMEMIGMTIPGMQGVVTGNWEKLAYKPTPKTRNEILLLWDQVTEQIDRLWPKISSNRFQEVDVAFGLYEGPIYDTIFYFIDNEIHHRGQGYVYLRSLGIEPPFFWDRD